MSVRSQKEILDKAAAFEEMYRHGTEVVKDQRVITLPHAMGKVAEALRWAAGEDNDVSELIARPMHGRRQRRPRRFAGR